MEISERSLRALVADTDEQQRASFGSMPDQIRALHSQTRPLRRNAASGDAGIAAFAQSVELTAVVSPEQLPRERQIVPAKVEEVVR